MGIKISIVEDLIKSYTLNEGYSGVVIIEEGNKKAFEGAYGLSNKSEGLVNKVDTKFGIASGCKIFTGVAICQLVDKGLISFESTLKSILKDMISFLDDQVTIHHLLTHTSGLPDYFDEEVMENFEDLWKNQPMYMLKEVKDFLPLIEAGKKMSDPGKRFHYNNGGYILLGLVIEEVSGMKFNEFIERYIFTPCGMDDSGYFSFDQLPKNTALGYIKNEIDGSWKSNIYSLPVVGGPDGGAYVTAPDMVRFWEGLFSHKLLSREITDQLLYPHVQVESDPYFYGYGVWIVKDRDDSIYKYHVMGYDPGVGFRSAVYPKNNMIIVVTGNTDYGTHQIARELQNIINI